MKTYELYDWILNMLPCSGERNYFFHIIPDKICVYFPYSEL